MDYTPQAVYWLGGELSENKEFEWTDGSAMNFQVPTSKWKFYEFLILEFNLYFIKGVATRPRSCKQATE